MRCNRAILELNLHKISFILMCVLASLISQLAERSREIWRYIFFFLLGSTIDILKISRQVTIREKFTRKHVGKRLTSRSNHCAEKAGGFYCGKRVKETKPKLRWRHHPLAIDFIEFDANVSRFHLLVPWILSIGLLNAPLTLPQNRGKNKNLKGIFLMERRWDIECSRDDRTSDRAAGGPHIL